ncbi:RQC domain-containing protein, partial [Chryseobacterium sp. SIMBA_029]
GEKFKSKDLISVIVGKETAVTKSYKLEQNPHFSFGKDEKENYWKTILRQATVQNYLQKDIETYGVLKIAEKGREVLSGKSKDTFL